MAGTSVPFYHLHPALDFSRIFVAGDSTMTLDGHLGSHLQEVYPGKNYPLFFLVSHDKFSVYCMSPELQKFVLPMLGDTDIFKFIDRYQNPGVAWECPVPSTCKIVTNFGPRPLATFTWTILRRNGVSHAIIALCVVPLNATHDRNVDHPRVILTKCPCKLAI